MERLEKYLDCDMCDEKACVDGYFTCACNKVPKELKEDKCKLCCSRYVEETDNFSCICPFRRF